MRTVGLESEVGPIHSWGDNFDLVVFTPNGRRTTHAMATQFVQNPAGILFPGGATPGGEVMSLQLPRLTKLERSLKLGNFVWLTRAVLSLNITQAPRS